MTNEKNLMEEFFRVFGIEPKNKCGKNLIYPNCLNPDKCGYDNCIYYQIEYPEITAEKLLEMICILNLTNGTNYTAYRSKNISDLKEETLEECMKLSGDIELKPKIQQLFKD